MLNEHFTASIESVNSSQSMLYSSESKNRNRSAELQSEVDAWLANKNNSVKELPLGFTKHKDGIIPNSTENAKANKKSEQERKKELEKKNAEIKAYKEALQAQRKAEQERKKKEREKEKLRIKREKEAKAKAKQKPVTKIVKKSNKKELKLVEFPEHPEKFRRLMMSMLRKEAQARGEKHFIGKCKHHGWNQYNIEVHNVRCTGCMADTAAKLRAKSKFESNKVKSEKQKAAIAKGEKTFMARCRHHGETLYAVRNTASPVCIQCRKGSEKKANTRSMEKRKRKNTYYYEMKAARDSAKAQGLKSFDFKCKKCGEFEQRIRTDGTSYCLNCSKEADRLRKNGARLKFNSDAKDEAISKGLIEFIGSCQKHGETKFSVYYERENSRYRCADCVLESQREIRESNKQSTAECVKRKFLNDWFEENKQITKKAFYKKIGWSKSSLHNYLSGVNEISDQKFNEFKEFIKKLESNNEEN